VPTAHRRISCAGSPPSHTARSQVRQFHSAETSRSHISGKLAAVSGFLELENVEPAVWLYEVSGKQVVPHWFSYRKKHRERPIIGDRRPPSPLGDIQPNHWLPEYTSELLNLLNVLGLLVELEPAQADLLEKVCSGPLISHEDLSAAGALELPPKAKKKKAAKKNASGPGLFDSHGKQ
jgi:hypothetical protein